MIARAFIIFLFKLSDKYILNLQFSFINNNKTFMCLTWFIKESVFNVVSWSFGKTINLREFGMYSKAVDWTD